MPKRTKSWHDRKKEFITELSGAASLDEIYDIGMRATPKPWQLAGLVKGHTLSHRLAQAAMCHVFGVAQCHCDMSPTDNKGTWPVWV